jgi:hypothetical protein
VHREAQSEKWETLVQELAPWLVRMHNSASHRDVMDKQFLMSKMTQESSQVNLIFIMPIKADKSNMASDQRHGRWL